MFLFFISFFFIVTLDQFNASLLNKSINWNIKITSCFDWQCI